MTLRAAATLALALCAAFAASARPSAAQARAEVTESRSVPIEGAARFECKAMCESPGARGAHTSFKEGRDSRFLKRPKRCYKVSGQ